MWGGAELETKAVRLILSLCIPRVKSLGRRFEEESDAGGKTSERSQSHQVNDGESCLFRPKMGRHLDLTISTPPGWVDRDKARMCPSFTSTRGLPWQRPTVKPYVEEGN